MHSPATIKHPFVLGYGWYIDGSMLWWMYGWMCVCVCVCVCVWLGPIGVSLSHGKEMCLVQCLNGWASPPLTNEVLLLPGLSIPLSSIHAAPWLHPTHPLYNAHPPHAADHRCPCSAASPPFSLLLSRLLWIRCMLCGFLMCFEECWCALSLRLPVCLLFSAPSPLFLCPYVSSCRCVACSWKGLLKNEIFSSQLLWLSKKGERK